LWFDLVIDRETGVYTLPNCRDAEHGADSASDPTFSSNYLSELFVRHRQTQDDRAAAAPRANLNGVRILDELPGNVAD